MKIILFDLGFTARQEDYTRFEPSKSYGGAKTGDPRGNPFDHTQAELVCLTCDPI